MDLGPLKAALVLTPAQIAPIKQSPPEQVIEVVRAASLQALARCQLADGEQGIATWESFMTDCAISAMIPLT